MSSRATHALSAGAVLLGALILLLAGKPNTAAAVVGATDLGLTKSDSVDPAAQNTNFTYTIVVTNAAGAGQNDAAATTVTDTLPSQVDFVSATATGGGTCNRAGNTVTCQLGQVNVGESRTVSIVVKAKKTGTASNTASVAHANVDPVATNNQDTETTVISKKATGKNKKVAPSCAAPTITGTAAGETLVGTAGNDVIRGYAGNDVIFGNGGADLICGNLGADRGIGGPGADRVVGGPGPDRLFGGTGGDLIKGSAGRDLLRGQRGNDALNGGRNGDNCKGGAGRDSLRSCP